jgi:hypothetical protein
VIARSGDQPERFTSGYTESIQSVQTTDTLFSSSFQGEAISSKQELQSNCLIWRFNVNQIYVAKDDPISALFFYK